jgi:ABC-2 type transport system ATP-binding protein
MSNAPAIRAVRASKWYGSVAALSDVSFDVGAGVWGLLGPNGSGKSTLMRLCTGQLRPSLGELRVCGQTPFANPEVLARIGLCPESDALYPHLTAFEHVSLLGQLSGLAAGPAAQKARELLVQLGLGEAIDVRVSAFSRGMRQRVKIAQALVHDPDMLVLDEPLTGTDPLSRGIILAEVRRRAERGVLVLFSSHVLPEIEALTERVIVLVRGRLVALGSARDIRDALDQMPHTIRVECDDPRRLGALLCARPEVLHVRFDREQSLELDTHAPEPSYEAVGKLCLEHGVRVKAITSPDDNLEVLLTRLCERAERPAQEHASHPRAPVPFAPSPPSSPGGAE